MCTSCPLCHNKNLKQIHSGEGRDYLQCNQCLLVHVPAKFHLSNADEKAIYDHHQNNPNDQGYREFLNQLLVPLISRLEPGACGLDFGSGPGPTLSVMLEEQGFSMEIYDKFYADQPAVLRKSYDFITATEVVEHLASPGEVLKRLWRLLQPGGHLAIMTLMLPASRLEFASWHYKRDPTHISFFAQQSLEWLNNSWPSKLELLGNVAIFEKL